MHPIRFDKIIPYSSKKDLNINIMYKIIMKKTTKKAKIKCMFYKNNKNNKVFNFIKIMKIIKFLILQK